MAATQRAELPKCVLLLRSAQLDIVATADGPELVDMAAQKDWRLCDSCFNYRSLLEYDEPAPTPALLRTSSGGGLASSVEPVQAPAVVQTSQDAASDREQLLAGGQSLPADRGAMSTVGAARYGCTHRVA